MSISLGDTGFPHNTKCTAELELHPEGREPVVVAFSWVSPGGVSPENPAWPDSIRRVTRSFHEMLGLRK